jgi:maltose/moltooligosaccharide transporter
MTLIIQPIIGYFSDRTWTKLERKPTFSRRYFSFGSIIYNAQFSVLWFGGWSGSWTPINSRWNHFVLLLAIIFRKTTYHGIGMQSFFIDWRFASKLPFFTYYGVQNMAPLGVIPDSVKYSFT